MKESLIVFFVSFGLTIGCSALKIITGISGLSFFIFSYSNFLTIIITLTVIGIFFGIFYLLANTKNVVAKKSTTIAILLGIILGGAGSVFILLKDFAFAIFVTADIFTSFITSSFVLYFFPSLTALLLVELNNKKQQAPPQSTLQN